jgi:hypothetical protein
MIVAKIGSSSRCLTVLNDLESTKNLKYKSNNRLGIKRLLTG